MTARRPMRALHTRQGRVRSDDDRGFSTLEAVVVIPAVVIITMLVVQYVMLWHARNIAEAAAQNGLRTARGYESSAAAGEAIATGYLQQVAGHLLRCDDRCVHASRGADRVTVTVHASVLSVLPFGSFSVTESAAGPVEKYTRMSR
jgi:hypothetical protein